MENSSSKAGVAKTLWNLTRNIRKHMASPSTHEGVYGECLGLREKIQPPLPIYFLSFILSMLFFFFIFYSSEMEISRNRQALHMTEIFCGIKKKGILFNLLNFSHFGDAKVFAPIWKTKWCFFFSLFFFDWKESLKYELYQDKIVKKKKYIYIF